MSVISTIKDDRKYRLLEDRMQKSDQQQYLSPQPQSTQAKNAQVNLIRSNDDTRSTIIDTTAIIDVSEDDRAVKSAADSANIAGRIFSVSDPPVNNRSAESSATVFLPIAEIFDLIDADDSKASGSNKSLSRSNSSPGMKENKDMESKNDNISRSLKRQSNGNVESKSPKILKTEGGENIPTDQSTAINQGEELSALVTLVILLSGPQSALFILLVLNLPYQSYISC